MAGAGVDPPTPALALPTLTPIATAPKLIQRPRRATANYSTEIYARNGQGPRVADSTNRRRIEQYHETVSEADLEQQLRSRDEHLANGRQVVGTETEDETDDQRMEEELYDERLVKRQRSRQIIVVMMIARMTSGTRKRTMRWTRKSRRVRSEMRRMNVLIVRSRLCIYTCYLVLTVLVCIMTLIFLYFVVRVMSNS